jgi:hypothetical protein
MYSILHISDLHRSPDGPISNDELISTLRADRHRYVSEEPEIRTPDAIVVSGDIVQGVPLGTANHLEELRCQYSIAEDFLARLCEEFIGGDRSRVVLVPGNHDVDWNTSRAAMAQVADGKEPRPEVAFREDSLYRWDWRTKRFYQIIDQNRYSQRLDAFWDFAERFYTGVPGLFRFTRGSDYNVFRLCDNRIGVAAFNSCDGNDCFAYHGSIKRQAISASHLELGSAPYPFELWLAVWHHNIEGPPYRTDYMDMDLVRNMIGRGFRLGLYGHQHRTQAEPRHIFLPDRNTMAAVGAGSLCAGPKELPTGFYRQYTLIELADNLQSARVHVRQMETAQLFSQAHLNSVGGRSYVDLEWGIPKEIAARLAATTRVPNAQAIFEAERSLKNQKFQDAISILEPLIVNLEGYGRAVFFEAAIGVRRWDLVIKHANPPQSVQELISLVEAYEQTRQVPLGRDALTRYGEALKMPEAMNNELLKRLAIREMQTK